MREGERGRNPIELGFIVQSLNEEFPKEKQGHTNINLERVQKWVRPPEGIMKINVDGAFKNETGQGGWGAVIRNEEGEVVKAGAGNISHTMDTFHAEMVAAREGIRLAAKAGMGHVIMKTDAMLVKFAMQNDGFRLSPLGGLIWEIKTMVACSFSSISFDHCYRSCNRIAHALAAIGCIALRMPTLIGR